MQYTLSSNSPFSDKVISSFMTDKKAVRVLPLPVGAETKILFLLSISFTAKVCGGEKFLNFFLNQSRVIGLSKSYISSSVSGFVLYVTILIQRKSNDFLVLKIGEFSICEADV